MTTAIEGQDDFRRQWPADTPWCEPHWRPRSVCAELRANPMTLEGDHGMTCSHCQTDTAPADAHCDSPTCTWCAGCVAVKQAESEGK